MSYSFEKMLYDQAQLALAYVTAYQITGHMMYAGVTQDILDYVEQKLRAPQRGFYSAEDADSFVAHNTHEKGEGAFYIWHHKGKVISFARLVSKLSQKSLSYWVRTHHCSASCTTCAKTAMWRQAQIRTTSSRTRTF